jgi:hypothetical protein
MPFGESHDLIFHWEVYNVSNLKRFDVRTITTDISSSSSSELVFVGRIASRKGSATFGGGAVLI